MDSDQIKSCHNCNKPLPENAVYCPFCSQKDTDGRIALKQFIGSFFESVFNVDSRFLKTLLHIFIPAKLTKRYFEGKHKSYSHPLRLFFGVAVIHIAVIGYVANKHINLEKTEVDKIESKLAKIETYKLIEEYELANQNALDDPELAATIDSLKRFVWNKGELQFDTTSTMPIMRFDFDSMKISPVFIKNHDIAKLSVDTLIHKYKIEDPLTKMMLQQQVKAQDNPKSVMLFGLGNMIWMLFVLLPATAFFMKLLYVRRKYFFVEHLVYLYHWHSVAFIFASIYFLLLSLIPESFIALLLFLILLFGFLALKKYYKQGFFKSLIKFILILAFYQIILGVMIAITSLISLLAF